MKFKTPYNATPTRGELKPALLPSLTIPDQAMTVAELLRRHSSGLPLMGSRVPMYDDNDDGTIDDSISGINLSTLDLSEREALLQQAKELQERLKKERAEQMIEHREKQKAARKAALRKEYEELQRDLNPEKTDRTDQG